MLGSKRESKGFGGGGVCGLGRGCGVVAGFRSPDIPLTIPARSGFCEASGGAGPEDVVAGLLGGACCWAIGEDADCGVGEFAVPDPNTALMPSKRQT